MLLDVNINIGFGLLTWAFRPVPLGIRHGDAESEIAVLHPVEIVDKALVIVGALGIIRSLCRLKDAVQSIMAQITLRAAGNSAHQSHGFQLSQKISRVLIDVEHPVDSFCGRALTAGHQGAMGTHMGKIIGHPHSIEARREKGLVGDARDLRAIHENPWLVGA
jgi:hypothetical protein